MTLIFNRRQAAGARRGSHAGAIALGAPAGARQERLRRGDQEIHRRQDARTEGKIDLDLPEIAENGNTVPITIRSTAR